MFIGLMIGGQAWRSAGAQPGQPSSATVLPTPLARDKLILDSGAARGANAASLPLSGLTDAADGAGIEARIVDAGSGAQVAPWSAVATATGGTWSGTYAGLSRHAGWLQAEVRVQGTGTVVSVPGRFGVGHVVAIWGQSEDNFIVRTGENPMTGPRPTLVDPDAVQIVFPSTDSSNRNPNFAAVTQEAVDDLTTASNSGTTPAVAAMVNALARHAPGEKFMVAFQVKSGSGLGLATDLDYVDGSGAEVSQRSWLTDVALHDMATADGATPVGLGVMSWFAHDRGQTTNYGQFVHQRITGSNIDGTDWDQHPANTHALSEIYDFDRTRFLLYGPHIFAPDETGQMQNAITEDDGSVEAGVFQIQQCRESMRAMLLATTSPAFLPVGLEKLNYRTGEADGNDYGHPAKDTPDGIERFAELSALAILQGLGKPIPRPVIDQAAWEADGAYVDFWSSAGNITTTRIARGLTALDSTQPGQEHWTEVVGFEINGNVATRAEIVADAGGSGQAGIRLYPLATETRLYGTDTIHFGRGGATGILNRSADLQADLWMNWPIVPFGDASVEGIALSALPSPAILSGAGVIADRAALFSFAGQTPFRRDFIGLDVNDAATGIIQLNMPASTQGNPVICWNLGGQDISGTVRLKGTLYIWSDAVALDDAGGWRLARASNEYLTGGYDEFVQPRATCTAPGEANAAVFDLDFEIDFSQLYFGVKSNVKGVPPARNWKFVNLRIA